MPGCTFTGFSDFNYGGYVQTLGGGITYPRVYGYTQGVSCADGFLSVKCECVQQFINCIPEDDFHVIFEADGTNTVTDNIFEYTKTIGTTYTEEHSESMTVSVGVDTAVSAGFFKLFEAELGISETTGFDWTDVSTETQGATKTYRVGHTWTSF